MINDNGDRLEPLTWKYRRNRNELLVYGFCRNYLYSMDDDDACDYLDVFMIIIATWISHNDRLCMNKKRDIYNLEISQSGQYLERISIEDGCFYHAFGQEIIGLNGRKQNESKKIWWLKILNIDENNECPNIGIGVIDDRFVMRLTERDNFLKMANCGYGISLNEKDENIKNGNKHEWKIGDTITMELDMNGDMNDNNDKEGFDGCGVLKFIRNGCINLIHEKVYVNKNMNYRLVISMYSQDVIVLL